MTRDLVNAASSLPPPPAAAASAQPRGKGFESLIPSDDADDRSSQPEGDDASKAPESGLATLLGVPGFFLQAAVAADVGEAAPAQTNVQATAGPVVAGAPVGPAVDVVSSSDSRPSQTAETEAPPSKSKAPDGRTPVATLAAALQAQADGFAAGRTAAQSANDALAASGVVRLHGSSAPGDLTLGAPTGQAAPVPAEIKAVGEGDAGKAGGGKSDGAKPDASRNGALLAEGGAVKSTPDPDAEIPEAIEIKGAGAPPDAARAPTDRIQTLQTSAAPATPAAQAGQPVVSGSVAAAVQVANEIASHAASRRSRFEVQLDPGDLGRVDVRLDIANDGRVSTRLIVERPETLDMLRNDARDLSRTLEQAGFQLGQGGLAFQLRDGRHAFQSDEAEPARATASDEIEDVAPVAAAYSRSLSAAAGGVDVKV